VSRNFGLFIQQLFWPQTGKSSFPLYPSCLQYYDTKTRDEEIVPAATFFLIVKNYLVIIEAFFLLELLIQDENISQKSLA
jgi:hypothetical protein